MTRGEWFETCAKVMELNHHSRKEDMKDETVITRISSQPHSSNEYDWIFKRKDAYEAEIFDVGALHFNINRAKRIIHLAPRPVIMVPLAPYAALLEMFVDLDHKDKAGRRYHLDFPIIIATLKRGGTIPIDGWHRIDKAIKEGLTRLPAVFLTAEETKVVRRK